MVYLEAWWITGLYFSHWGPDTTSYLLIPNHVRPWLKARICRTFKSDLFTFGPFPSLLQGQGEVGRDHKRSLRVGQEAHCRQSHSQDMAPPACPPAGLALEIHRTPCPPEKPGGLMMATLPPSPKALPSLPASARMFLPLPGRRQPLESLPQPAALINGCPHCNCVMRVSHVSQPDGDLASCRSHPPAGLRDP